MFQSNKEIWKGWEVHPRGILKYTKKGMCIICQDKKKEGIFLVWMSHFENTPFYSQKGKEIKDSSNQQEKTLLIAYDVCPYILKSQLWVMISWKCLRKELNNRLQRKRYWKEFKKRFRKSQYFRFSAEGKQSSRTTVLVWSTAIYCSRSRNWYFIIRWVF